MVRRGSISNAIHTPKWVKIQCNSTTRVAEEREEAAERRILLEIDRERLTRAEAERAATSSREALIEANKQAATRGELAADEIGQLKGKLAAADQMAGKRDEQLESIRREASALTIEVARCSGEAAAANDRISALEFELAAARAPKSKSAKARKP